MARRNTLTLEEIVDEGNSILARSTCLPVERQGVIVMLNKILHLCDNYGGFRYLDSTEVPPGEQPGIVPGYGEDGQRDNTKNKYPDETRVQFTIKKRNAKNDKKARAKRNEEFPISFVMELPNVLDRNGHPTIVGRFSVRDTQEEYVTIASTRRIYPDAVQALRSETQNA
jgi:hypothetical protein